MLFCKWAEDMHRATGKRVLMMVHRREIVEQMAATIERWSGLSVGVEMAEQRANHGLILSEPIVCASKDSLRSRLLAYDPSSFCALITDEAHHSTAKSYRKIAEHLHKNPDLYHLGVTATPDRTDEVGLENVFEAAPYTLGIREAMQDGWLVRVKHRPVRVKDLTFENIPTRAGDLAEAELEREMSMRVHEMVGPTLEIAGDRRFLVFAVRVGHAERAAEVFRRHGAEVAHVDGGMPKDRRDDIFRDYALGNLQGLVNCMIATEGWDDPALDGKGVQVIANMRPTKSRALYAQMIGRGTRPLPGTVDGLETAEERCSAIAASAKPSVTVIDFTGVAGRHKLITPLDVLAGSAPLPDATRTKAKSDRDGATREADVLDELDELFAEEAARKERESRRHVRTRNVVFETEEVDLFNAAHRPKRKLARHDYIQPPTVKQIDKLREFGVDDGDMPRTLGAAKLALDHLFQRATPKQQSLLCRLGYPRDKVSTLDKRSASGLIDRCKSNGWRRV